MAIEKVKAYFRECGLDGKSEVRMELLEQFHNAGFAIQLMEEGCEHFAVVDQNIVWYGNMNFLSKEDMEDNLMRVVSGCQIYVCLSGVKKYHQYSFY